MLKHHICRKSKTVVLTYEVGGIPNSPLLEEQESVSSKDHVQFTLLNLAYQKQNNLIMQKINHQDKKHEKSVS